MNDNDMLPRRIIWLAAITGVLTVSLFLVGLANLSSILLILGALIQARFPRLARWLIWLGAAQLSILVFGMDAVSLQHPLPYHDLGTSVFSWAVILSTCAVVWCDAELVTEALKRFRNQQYSTPPLNTYEWIFMIFLNLSTLAGAVLAIMGYRISGNRYTLITSVAWLLVVAVADFSIIKLLQRNHA